MSSDASAPVRAIWAKVGRQGLRADASPGQTITERTYRSASAPPPAPRTPPPIPVIPLDSAAREPRGADLQVVGVLGEGGMGRVHLARQRSLGRDVAVKVTKPGADAAARDALFREGAFMGLLEHPNVVPVHALGRDADGSPLLVMKRIEGVSWQDLLEDPAHPAWERVESAPGDRLAAHLQILLQLCNALALAHERGIVHRDIKPANVMLGAFGEVYLVDFGIATTVPPPADTGVESTEPLLVGTPGYMPPEMAACETALIDPRTDVYLLGATLHQVLTGERRHTGVDLLDVLMKAHASDAVVYGPNVPPELAKICNRATSRDRDDRFPTVLAMRQAIADYVRHRGSIALTDAATARLDDLRRALDAPGAGRAKSDDVHRLTTECRFGFMQALREWPENPAAQRGLSDCLSAMIEHEIRIGNASGARALLLEAPSPSLEARVRTLEAELQEKELRATRAATIERELDVSASARGRALLFGALLAVGLGLAVQMLVRGGDVDKYSYDEVLIEAAATVVGFGVLTAIFRRRILGNAVSRRIVASAWLGPLSMLVTRVIGKVRGEPLTRVLVVDQVLFVVLIAMAGINIHRPILWTLPILMGGLIATAGWPQLSAVAFTVSTLSICVGVGVTGLRARTQKRG
ncbi:MAG: serine/threonine-protein kinase [Polyangiaceae bacterium]